MIGPLLSQEVQTPLSVGYAPRSQLHPPAAASQAVPNISAVGDLFEPVADAGTGRGAVQGADLQYPILPAWSRRRTYLTGECLMEVRGPGPRA